MFKTSQQAYRSVGIAGHAPIAGTSADVTGDAIDRMQLSSGQQGYQACRAILTTGALAGTAGAYARIVCEDSSTGTDGWAALTDPATGTQYVSGTIGTASVTSIGVDLSRAKRYVRFTSEITGTGTTTLVCGMAVDLLGGFVQPAGS